MRHRHHLPALLLSTAALCALGLLPTGASAAPRARTASVCNIKGKEESLGPTYVTYLEVRGGASCGFALHLVRSYYQCRVKHGGIQGYCSGVDGFRCSEKRYLKIKVQYDASVTCTRGSERVFHKYTQFT